VRALLRGVLVFLDADIPVDFFAGAVFLLVDFFLLTAISALPLIIKYSTYGLWANPY
jgi:hypothetical protein